jgi:diguanylate cyclase (GGDEF)-like protein/hemerythrin-like metal-binding protein
MGEPNVFASGTSAYSPNWRSKYLMIWLVIAVPFVVLIGYLSHEARLAAIVAAGINAENLTLVLESELRGNFANADRAVTEMANQTPLEALRQDRVGKFREAIDGKLKFHVRNIVAATALRIFAANGDALYSSLDGEGIANIADRNFFQSLKADPTRPTIFSEVVVGRYSGRPSIIVARAMRDRSNAFLGAAVVGLDLTAINEQFRNIKIGTEGAVALRRLENGASVVRFPGPVVVDNKPAPDLPVRQAILKNGPVGVIETQSPVDGVHRIYGYRTVGEYPFFITVGIAANDYLKEWQRNLVASMVASSIFLVILAAVFFRLARADSQRQSMETALQRNRELLSEAQQIAKVGGWEYDVQTRQISWTKEVFRIHEVAADFDPNDITRNFQFFAAEDRVTLLKAFELACSAGEPYDLELQLTGAQGTRKWVRTSARAEMAEGMVQRIVGDIQDITERKVSEVRIGFLATHDRLTELPNRELFYDRLAQAISRASRKSERLAVLFVDLDDFKPINDTYGHQAGDLALIMTARRLHSCVRGMDTVARLGGDEFAVVLGDIESPEDARLVASKMIASLCEPMKLQDGLQCQLGASIGIATYPENGAEIDSLIHAADGAMFESKTSGKNICTFARDLAKEGATDAQWMILDSSKWVGVPIIDEQHQVIVSMLNKLNTAFKSAEPIELTTRLFDDLTNYTHFHFETENRLMELHDYPEFSAHRQAHQKLLDEAAYLRGKFIRGSELLVLQSLKDWLFLHIHRFDMPLAHYLLEQDLFHNKDEPG